MRMRCGICLALLALLFMHYGQCSNEGFIIRHYSGLCLSVRNETNKLYLERSCIEKFKWTRFHTIMHLKTSMCLIPDGNDDDSKIFLKEDCRGTSGAFRFTANMSLQHIKSSKCMHPYWGCPVPSEGEDMVLHSTCDERRLRFEFIKDNIDCQPLYPYCQKRNENVSKSSELVNTSCVKGLEWHWVYVLTIFGSGILLAQWAVIVCIYGKMRRQHKQQINEYPQFGSTNERKRSLPYNDAESVEMLGITSTVDNCGWRFSDFSDTSSLADDKTCTQSKNEEEVKINEVNTNEEKRSYINIDYNQNKKGKKNSLGSQKDGKKRQSRRVSKLSIDFSKMRQVFKVRKSYTFNDFEKLKRISIERHQYEEPISPCSLGSSPLGAVAKKENSEYVQPDEKNVRGRSASVPSKMTQPSSQQGYLQPVCSSNDKTAGSEKMRRIGVAYANAKPISPTRLEKNLYDAPELSLIEEREEARPAQIESHTYVKILED